MAAMYTGYLQVVGKCIAHGSGESNFRFAHNIDEENQFHPAIAGCVADAEYYGGLLCFQWYKAPLYSTTSPLSGRTPCLSKQKSGIPSWLC